MSDQQAKSSGRKVLRAALIGAGGFGTAALQALRQSRNIHLTGLSDRQSALAQAAAAEAACPAYGDDRRLLVETRPEAVFLAVPPAPGGDLVQLAARQGLHVWMQPPLARNLAEAVGLCRTMDRAARKFVVGLQRRFAGAYRRARAMLPRLGRPYLLQAHYLCNLGPSTGWRADRASGGGALRELAYPMLDLVIWLLGLPESVYSVVGAVPADRRPMDQPVYDTEDTAVVVFRYGDNAAATITVSRCFSPVSEGLTAYCERGVLTADAVRCVARDRDGRALDSYDDPEPPAALFGRMIDAFVAAAEEDAATYACSAWEDLLTVAAVDAADLSDRTRQPELPQGLLGGYDVTPGDCLKAAPAAEDER